MDEKKPMAKKGMDWNIFSRLMRYVFSSYKWHLLLVILGIFVGVLANVQGTLFMQTLIDVYILPMIGSSEPDFGPLAAAILKVGIFYGIGVCSTWMYNRIMVKVTQGTLRGLRDDLFTHMESLPIQYFDTHAHGDIMSVYTNDIDTLRQMISQSLPKIFASDGGDYAFCHKDLCRQEREIFCCPAAGNRQGKRLH